jgi:hypothetical protein
MTLFFCPSRNLLRINPTQLDKLLQITTQRLVSEVFGELPQMRDSDNFRHFTLTYQHSIRGEVCSSICLIIVHK